MDKEHPMPPDLSGEVDPQTIAFWEHYTGISVETDTVTSPNIAETIQHISSGSYPLHDSLIPPCCRRK